MLAWGISAAIGFEKANNKGLLSLLNESQACPISPRGTEPAKGQAGEGTARDAPRSTLRCIRRCSAAAPAPPRE